MSLLQVTTLVNKIDEYVRYNTVDVEARHNTVSTIIGCALGTQMPIPSTKVKNVRIHYNDQIYVALVKTLDVINEAHSIAIDVALQTAYLTWMDRYRIVHPGVVNIKDITSRLSALSDVGKSEKDIAMLDDLVLQVNANDVDSLNVIVSELLNQLSDKDSEE